MSELLTVPSTAISGNPVLEASPNPAFVDEEVRIRLRGLAPGGRVLIAAETKDDEGRRWTSSAEFAADTDGTVAVAEQAALRGSYSGVLAMGLFWSMTLAQSERGANSTFTKTDAEPNKVRISATVDGRVVASTLLERRFVEQGTSTRDLRIGGGPGESGDVTVGRLFIPDAPGPHPVVMVLSGSGGGFDIDKAAVLSRHGFATFALAYFGIEPLPSWLNRVPLEYFQGALDWLGSQSEVDAERIGVLGISRGAELALLLGSRFARIRAVVAYAPSSVAWAASGRDKATGEIIPCWTYHGEPVPFAPLPLRGFMARSAFPVAALKRPVMFRNLFRAGLRNRSAVKRGAIPIEETRGPILLISGGNDHLWPANEMSEAIVARLKQKGFSYAVEHRNYPDAGHMLRYPFLPTTSRVSSNKHLRGAKFSFGGNAAADAEAQAHAWRRAVGFLQKHL
jgi:dienelactone hydrolase